MHKKCVGLAFVTLGMALALLLLAGHFCNTYFVPPLVTQNAEIVPQAIRCASNTHTFLHAHQHKSHAQTNALVRTMYKKDDEDFEAYAVRLTSLANQHMTQWFIHKEKLASFADAVHVTTSFMDNYVYWLFANLKFLLGMPRHIEFIEPEQILYRGYGFCSQHALLIASILERQHIEARIHSLGGHVVPSMRTPQGDEFVLDTNANLVLHGSPETLAKQSEILEKAYFQAWYRFYMAFAANRNDVNKEEVICRAAQEDAQSYAAMYTSLENNKVFTGTNNYVNYKVNLFYRVSEILKYLLPCIFIAIGIFLQFSRKEKANISR